MTPAPHRASLHATIENDRFSIRTMEPIKQQQQQQQKQPVSGDPSTRGVTVTEQRQPAGDMSSSGTSSDATPKVDHLRKEAPVLNGHDQPSVAQIQGLQDQEQSVPKPAPQKRNPAEQLPPNQYQQSRPNQQQQQQQTLDGKNAPHPRAVSQNQKQPVSEQSVLQKLDPAEQLPPNQYLQPPPKQQQLTQPVGMIHAPRSQAVVQTAQNQAVQKHSVPNPAQQKVNQAEQLPPNQYQQPPPKQQPVQQQQLQQPASGNQARRSQAVAQATQNQAVQTPSGPNPAQQKVNPAEQLPPNQYQHPPPKQQPVQQHELQHPPSGNQAPQPQAVAQAAQNQAAQKQGASQPAPQKPIPSEELPPNQYQNPPPKQQRRQSQHPVRENHSSQAQIVAQVVQQQSAPKPAPVELDPADQLPPNQYLRPPPKQKQAVVALEAQQSATQKGTAPKEKKRAPKKNQPQQSSVVAGSEPAKVKIVPVSTEKPVVAKTVGRFKVLASTASIVPAVSGEAHAALATSPDTPSVATAPAVPAAVSRANGGSPEGLPAAGAASLPAPGGGASSVPANLASQTVTQPISRPPAAVTALASSSPGSTMSSVTSPTVPPNPSATSGKPPAGPSHGKKKGRFMVLAPGQQPATAGSQQGQTQQAVPHPVAVAAAAAVPVAPASSADLADAYQQGQAAQALLHQEQQQRQQVSKTVAAVEQLPVAPSVPVTTPPATPGAHPTSGASYAAASGTHPQPMSPPPEKSRSRGSSLTKPPASFDSNGIASQNGLGKVYYFLDQMRLEVADADKTIRGLQIELKVFKEKNKELEARAREMERRWNDEKASKEMSEQKVRTLRKRVRELKEIIASSGAPNVDGGADSFPNSRANSLDSIEGETVVEVGRKVSHAVSSLEGSPKRSQSQANGSVPKLTTIASTDSNSLAEKQEVLDLKMDHSSANSLALSSDSSASSSSPIYTEKQNAMKRTTSPTKPAEGRRHRRTSSVGADGGDTSSPRRRRVSSEDNMEVFLGENASASSAPTALNAKVQASVSRNAVQTLPRASNLQQTNGGRIQHVNGSHPLQGNGGTTAHPQQGTGGAAEQKQHTNGMAAAHRLSTDFDPLAPNNGRRVTVGDAAMQQTAGSGQGGAFDPLGTVSRPELQHTKSTPNMPLVDSSGGMSNLVANSGSSDSIASLTGGQQGAMPQQQHHHRHTSMNMTEQHQQSMNAMGQVPMNGGMQSHHVRAQTWGQNALQQQNLMRPNSTGNVDHFFHQQQGLQMGQIPNPSVGQHHQMPFNQDHLQQPILGQPQQQQYTVPIRTAGVHEQGHAEAMQQKQVMGQQYHQQHVSPAPSNGLLTGEENDPFTVFVSERGSEK